MSERINKTSICSVIFLDIIDYSKMSVSDQSDIKEHFNVLISEAIKDVAQNDRIILDTGDGAAISMLGAPEEALFVSMTIRDGILKHNKQSDQQLFVRIGINLGPVRVVTDINGRPNVIGDGINVAQRVMSFAEPNQILVSRSYYEITSRLTKEITRMFTYSGVKHDKHVREHEVYAIRATSEEVPITTELPEYPQEPVATEIRLSSNKRIWIVLVVSLTGIVGIVFSLSAEMHTTAPELAVPATPQPVIVPTTVSAPANSPSATKGPTKPAAKNQVKPVKKPAEKSGWDTFKQSVKQGGKNECTQGEVALGQCR